MIVEHVDGNEFEFTVPISNKQFVVGDEIRAEKQGIVLEIVSIIGVRNFERTAASPSQHEAVEVVLEQPVLRANALSFRR